MHTANESINTKYIIKEICDERFRSISEKVNDLKDDLKDFKSAHERNYKEIDKRIDKLNIKLDKFKFEVYLMVEEASKGKLKVEKRMSLKEKIAIGSTIIVSVISLIIAIIEKYGG